MVIAPELEKLDNQASFGGLIKTKSETNLQSLGEIHGRLLMKDPSDQTTHSQSPPKNPANHGPGQHPQTHPQLDNNHHINPSTSTSSSNHPTTSHQQPQTSKDNTKHGGQQHQQHEQPKHKDMDDDNGIFTNQIIPQQQKTPADIPKVQKKYFWNKDYKKRYSQQKKVHWGQDVVDNNRFATKEYMNPLMEKSIYAEKTRSHEYRLTPGQSLEMPLPWQAYLKEGSPQDIDEFTDKVHHWQRRHINELANKLEDDETPDQIRQREYFMRLMDEQELQEMLYVQKQRKKLQKNVLKKQVQAFVAERGPQHLYTVSMTDGSAEINPQFKQRYPLNKLNNAQYLAQLQFHVNTMKKYTDRDVVPVTHTNAYTLHPPEDKVQRHNNPYLPIHGILKNPLQSVKVEVGQDKVEVIDTYKIHKGVPYEQRQKLPLILINDKQQHSLPQFFKEGVYEKVDEETNARLVAKAKEQLSIWWQKQRKQMEKKTQSQHETQDVQFEGREEEQGEQN